MKKMALFVGVLLGTMLMLMNVSMVAAAPGGWTPDPDLIPEYDHYMGKSLTAEDDPLLTGVTELRLDFWTKGDEATLISITIINETNVLEQAIPEEIATVIEDYLQGSVEINTLYDLISIGLGAIANLDANFESVILDPAEYEYLTKGIALYSDTYTLAVVEDENLALIAMNVPAEMKPATEAELDAAINVVIDAVNAIIDALMDLGGISPAGAPVLNEDVLTLVNSVSAAYGENGPQGGVPGYSLAILGLVSILATVILIRKRH